MWYGTDSFRSGLIYRAAAARGFTETLVSAMEQKRVPVSK